MNPILTRLGCWKTTLIETKLWRENQKDIIQVLHLLARASCCVLLVQSSCCDMSSLFLWDSCCSTSSQWVSSSSIAIVHLRWCDLTPTENSDKLSITMFSKMTSSRLRSSNTKMWVECWLSCNKTHDTKWKEAHHVWASETSSNDHQEREVACHTKQTTLDCTNKSLPTSTWNTE